MVGELELVQQRRKKKRKRKGKWANVRDDDEKRDR
jgi:hypothetical protein